MIASKIPAKSDVIAPCQCGGTMSIAVVEQMHDRRQHTFICETCAGAQRFVFPSPSIAPSISPWVAQSFMAERG